jgi:DNA-binding beta-propeller fold protein YncE
MAGTPQGLSVSPDGKLLLAACLDGNVAVFKIDGGTVTFAKTVAVSTGRLSGVTFTHDGAHALVGMRDEGGLAVLDISNGAVTMSNQRITTGYTPYAIDISGDGKWAVVSAVGPPARPGLSRTADADIVTLVDVSKSPFRAAQHLSVPPVPESVAISPDGKWIAVLSMDGSSYAPTNPARTKTGKVALFAIRNGHATQVDEKPSGVAGQGIVFAADSKTIVVQMNPEKALGIFAVQNGRLVDTKQRLQLNAGPTSLRTLPR